MKHGPHRPSGCVKEDAVAPTKSESFNNHEGKIEHLAQR